MFFPSRGRDRSGGCSAGPAAGRGPAGALRPERRGRHVGGGLRPGPSLARRPSDSPNLGLAPIVTVPRLVRTGVLSHGSKPASPPPRPDSYFLLLRGWHPSCCPLRSSVPAPRAVGRRGGQVTGSGAGTLALELAWGPRVPGCQGDSWPVRVPGPRSPGPLVLAEKRSLHHQPIRIP